MFRLQRYENFVVAANIFPLNGVFPPVMDNCSIKLRMTRNTRTFFLFITSDWTDRTDFLLHAPDCGSVKLRMTRNTRTFFLFITSDWTDRTDFLLHAPDCGSVKLRMTRNTRTFFLFKKHRIGRIERIFSYPSAGIFAFSCFSCHS